MNKYEIGKRSLINRYHNGLYEFLDGVDDVRFMKQETPYFNSFIGQIPNMQVLVDELASQTPEYATRGPLDLLMRIKRGERPLAGKSVGVINGPEAVIFSELGASEAVSIAPWLSELPGLNRPGLREIDGFLHEGHVAEFRDRFDITYTHVVMDPGSGVNMQGDMDCLPLDDPRYRRPYVNLLNQILQMTRPGGISLHSGGMLPLIVPHVKDMISGAVFIEADGRRPYGDPFSSMALLYRK